MQKSQATKQLHLHMLDLVSFVTSLKGKRDAFNAAPEHVCSSHIEPNIRGSTKGDGLSFSHVFTLVGIGLFLHQRCDLAS